MGQNTDEIRIAPTGTVYVGATSATAPTSVSSMLSGFTDLGLLNEDGVTITDEKTITDIPVWQLLYPARKVITGRNFTAGFTLAQWNPDTLSFAFGGADVSMAAVVTPPAAETIDERSLIIDWSDNNIDYRLYLPRGLVTDNVETKLSRGSASLLPITFSIIGEAGSDPWTLFTNDGAFS